MDGQDEVVEIRLCRQGVQTMVAVKRQISVLQEQVAVVTELEFVPDRKMSQSN